MHLKLQFFNGWGFLFAFFGAGGCLIFFFYSTKLKLHTYLCDCDIFSLQSDLKSAEVMQKLLLAYIRGSEGTAEPVDKE